MTMYDSLRRVVMIGFLALATAAPCTAAGPRYANSADSLQFHQLPAGVSQAAPVDLAEPDADIRSITTSPDGKYVAWMSKSGTLTLCDVATNGLTTLEPDREVNRRVASLPILAFSSDGKTLTAGQARTVMSWDVATRTVLATHIGGPADERDKEFRYGWISANGERVVAVGKIGGRYRDLRIHIFDPRTNGKGVTVEHLNGDDGDPLVAISPDGSQVAFAASDGVINRWDANTGRTLPSVNMAGRRACDTRLLEFSKDGDGLVVAYKDDVFAFDVSDARAAPRLRQTFQAEIRDGSVLSPDGQRLTGSESVYDMNSGEPLYEIDGEHVSFSPDGRYLVTADYDDLLTIRDAVTAKPHRILRDFDEDDAVWAFSPDGTRLFTAAPEHPIQAWDLKSQGSGIQTAAFNMNSEVATAFKNIKGTMLSPDSTRLLVWGEGQKRHNLAKVFDIVTGREFCVLEDPEKYGRDPRAEFHWVFGAFAFQPGNDGAIVGLIFSCDGVSASDHYKSLVSVVKWDSSRGGVTQASRIPDLPEPFGHPGHIYTPTGLGASMDGTKMAITFNCSDLGYTTGVAILDLPSHAIREFQYTKGYKGGTNPALAFSADGRLLLGGESGARLWNTADMREQPLMSKDDYLNVWFAGEGSRFVTKQRRKLEFWNAGTGMMERSEELPFVYAACAIPQSGKFYAVAGENRSILLRNLDSGQTEHVLTGHQNGVRAMDFTKDGRLLVSVDSNTVRLWKLHPDNGAAVTRVSQAENISVDGLTRPDRTSPSLTPARKWTDNTGRFSVTAEFVRATNGNVWLRMIEEGGRVRVLPVARLSLPDQRVVEKLTKPTASEH